MVAASHRGAGATAVDAEVRAFFERCHTPRATGRVAQPKREWSSSPATGPQQRPSGAPSVRGMLRCTAAGISGGQTTPAASRGPALPGKASGRSVRFPVRSGMTEGSRQARDEAGDSDREADPELTERAFNRSGACADRGTDRYSTVIRLRSVFSTQDAELRFRTAASH
jgi:hypothetical protein